MSEKIVGPTTQGLFSFGGKNISAIIAMENPQHISAALVASKRRSFSTSNDLRLFKALPRSEVLKSVVLEVQG